MSVIIIIMIVYYYYYYYYYYTVSITVQKARVLSATTVRHIGFTADDIS